MSSVDLTPILALMLVSTVIVSCILLYCYRNHMDRKAKERRRRRLEQSGNPHQEVYLARSSSQENLHRPQSSSSHYTNNANNHIAISIPEPAYNNNSNSIGDVDNDKSAPAPDIHRHRTQHNIVESGSAQSSPKPSNASLHQELRALPPAHSSNSLRKQYDLVLVSMPPTAEALREKQQKQLQQKQQLQNEIQIRLNELPKRLAATLNDPSPLPRPLQLHRPVITDTSVTSSAKVLGTIKDPNSTVTNQEAVIHVRQQTQERLAAPSSNDVVPGPSKPRSKTKEEETYLFKEELHRKSPQTILPEGYKPPQFTDVVPAVASAVETKSSNGTREPAKGSKGNDTDDLVSGAFNTAYLVLEPYMSTKEKVLLVDAASSSGSKTAAPASPAKSFFPVPSGIPRSPSPSSQRTQFDREQTQQPTPTTPAKGPQGSTSNPSTEAITGFPFPPATDTPPLPSLPTATSSSSFSSSPKALVPAMTTPSSHRQPHHPRVRAISPTLSDVSNSSSSTTMSTGASTARSSTSTSATFGSGTSQGPRTSDPLSPLSIKVSVKPSKSPFRAQQPAISSVRDMDMDQASPLSASVYSPTTPPSSGRTTTTKPRTLDQVLLKKQQDAPTPNLRSPSPEQESGSAHKRANNPQAVTGHGTSFSLFNYDTKEI
ncbi:hypothetical protein B0O80DRAFT_528074 [Mortierella sp. GBAus27b]|nr:hypothetical protein BGX31_006338 [Mortierella sp. GBA43]KAI8356470.1 hypothetical protein B0O80DRAFT_528074 [Mortierella sp. GBAus27b]